MLLIGVLVGAVVIKFGWLSGHHCMMLGVGWLADC